MTSLERINEAALNAARTMPVMQNSMLTALGYYLSGQGKARQQARDNARQDRQDASLNQYYSGELDIEKQNAAEKKRMDDAAITKTEATNAQDARSRAFEGGLREPKNFSRFSPQQQSDYYNRSYREALKNSDFDAANAILAQINAIPKTAKTFEGDIPLAQARTQYERTRHKDVQDKMRLVFQAADAATRARMSAALLRSRTQLRSSSMSMEARETIATMAALNAATAGGDKNALAVAMKQYDEDFKSWSASQKQFLKTGNAPAGFDPANPPSAETYVNNYISMPPTTTLAPVPLPNGKTIEVPTVKHGAVRNLAAERKAAQNAKAFVQQARIDGHSDKDIADLLRQNGNSDQQIQAALKGAMTFPGGGF